MLASINPLGERARNQRYAITVTAFTLGATVAAASFGAVLGAIGAFARADVAAVLFVALLAFLGAWIDVPSTRVRVPGPRRQVNENWLTAYRGWVYGLGFGAQLGVGLATIVATSLTWLALVCAAVSGSAVGGMLIGATFGVVRGAMILMTASVDDAGELRARMRRVDTMKPRVELFMPVLQVCIGAGLIGVLVAGRA
jgi:hypothetical protein